MSNEVFKFINNISLKRVKDNRISIVAELGTSIYTVQPIVEKLIEKGFEIDIYTCEDNLEKSKNYLGTESISYFAIDRLVGKYIGIIDYALKQLLTKNTFSSQYARIAPTENKLLKLFYVFAKVLPKPNQKKINKIYSKFWKFFNGASKFRSNEVLLVTRVNNTSILNNKNIKVYTLMESWDHPIKSPFYIESEVTYSWNKELSTDIKDIQNNSNEYKEIFPLKFRYLQQVKSLSNNPPKEIQNEIDFITNNNYVLYICTYSSYSRSDLFDNELKLISKIKEEVDRAGKHLYIKPHPHYSVNDFNSLPQSQNLRIGIGATNNGANYIFTDDDQYYKIQLLKNAERVINVGTTLVLEASMLNTNVYQLLISEENYGGFARACGNYHIKKYLNNNEEVINLSEGNELEKIASIVNEPQGSNSYASKLNDWLCQENINETINEITQDICNEKVSH